MKRALFLLALAMLGATRLPAAAVPSTVAITNATVVRGPGDRVEGATVIIKDGKIAAVGKGLSAPAGARAIDGTGMWITAGFIDAETRLGLNEVDLEASANDGDLAADEDQIHAAFRVVDAFNPGSPAIAVSRTGGVTTAVAVPVGGLVAGASAAVALADGKKLGDLLISAPLAMHMVLGDAARGAAQGSRGMAIERARELFDDVRAYKKNKNGYEKNQSRKLAASRLDLQALVPVLDGKLPLVVEAERAADVLAAVALAKEYRIKLVISGGVEAWMVAEELAAAKVPVLLDPTRNLPTTFERLNARDDAAAILAKAGVTVVISTLGDSANVRNLRQLCGIAVAWGLSWDQALAAVTTAPAAVFGLGKRGRLDVGAVADVVVWTGDPFELGTRPAHVFVRGVEQGLRTRQTLLFEKYRKLK